MQGSPLQHVTIAQNLLRPLQDLTVVVSMGSSLWSLVRQNIGGLLEAKGPIY